jgi:WD40 repeat protein
MNDVSPSSVEIHHHLNRYLKNGGFPRVVLEPYSPDGRWAVSGSDDVTLKVWELGTGELIYTLPCEGIILSACLSPSGILIAGDSFGRVLFFQLENFTPGPTILTA